MTFDITDKVEALINAAVACDLANAPELRQQGFIRMGNDLVLANGATGSQTVIPGRGGYGGDQSDVAAPEINTAYGKPIPETWKKWEDRIYPLFYNYKVMPQPSDFKPTLDGLQAVMEKLAINPVAFANVESGNAGSDLGFRVKGNPAFSVIDSADGPLTNMQGLAIEGFRKYVIGRFPLVTQRQYAVVQMIKGSVYAEQKLWENMQKDVTTLVEEATEAFFGSGVTIPFEVIGTILDIASLIPALDTITGPASTINDLLSKIPTGGESKSQFDIAGSDDAEKVWSSIQEAVKKLNQDAAKPEDDFASHLDAIAASMGSDPGSFDLSVIDDPNDSDSTPELTELEQETDPSNILSDKSVMFVEFQPLYDIGTDLINVSTEFSEAAGMLDGALASGPWSRYADIGRGYVGHFESADALAQRLVDALLHTRTGVQYAGEVIQVTAQRLQDVDEQTVAGRIRDLQTKLEQPAG